MKEMWAAQERHDATLSKSGTARARTTKWDGGPKDKTVNYVLIPGHEPVFL